MKLLRIEWYSNRANYSHDGFESIPGWWEGPGVFAHDEGEKARLALKQISEDLGLEGQETEEART